MTKETFKSMFWGGSGNKCPFADIEVDGFLTVFEWFIENEPLAHSLGKLWLGAQRRDVDIDLYQRLRSAMGYCERTIRALATATACADETLKKICQAEQQIAQDIGPESVHHHNTSFAEDYVNLARAARERNKEEQEKNEDHDI